MGSIPIPPASRRVCMDTRWVDISPNSFASPLAHPRSLLQLELGGVCGLLASNVHLRKAAYSFYRVRCCFVRWLRVVKSDERIKESQLCVNAAAT